MALTFAITLDGAEEVKKALKDLGARAAPAMGEALYSEGNELLYDSAALVPVDTGNLASSAYLTPPAVGGDGAFVTVGYGGAAAPYAVVVHENPRSGQTGGLSPSGKKYAHWAATGQWKYLETPFKARTAGFASRIAESLRNFLLRSR